ncbi:MAG: UDP-diphosphatase [Planctomycetes bacterium RBG_16_64_10]|nr:MAG: UDP-diphosphatase [Planctomycetes bacterium RBG_16_64_10]
MDRLEISLLGATQGLTEFLPVSSSGHLVVAAALLEAAGERPLPDVLEVTIVLHLGTLLAVLVFYAREVGRLLGADRRVIPLLVVGTLPAVLVGVPLERWAPALLENPLLVGLCLPVTGLLLIWASTIRPGTTRYQDLGYRQVLLIGLFQALAILPGISRSGSTIAAGLAVGMDRESSGTFAFLLAIPAIAGAGVLKAIDLIQAGGPATRPSLLLTGGGVAFLVGLVALWWLMAWLRQGRLPWFACWCIPLGIAVTLWQLCG